MGNRAQIVSHVCCIFFVVFTVMIKLGQKILHPQQSTLAEILIFKIYRGCKILTNILITFCTHYRLRISDNNAVYNIYPLSGVRARLFTQDTVNGRYVYDSLICISLHQAFMMYQMKINTYRMRMDGSRISVIDTTANTAHLCGVIKVRELPLC